MPKVHDAHPTSPFKYIDLNLISKWELLTGRKLIIPFGDAAHDPKLHDVIKNCILFAVAEITHSQGIGISAPTPSNNAKQLLLNRGIWSSQAITFRAVPFHPTNPDYLFTIQGFSLNIEEHIWTLVYNVWHDAETTTFVHNIINTAPEGEQPTLNYAIRTFLDTPTITCLNIKERGCGLTPCLNVHTDGAIIIHHTIWLDLCQFLADCIYFTPLIGQGKVITNPYSCGICHSVEHPKGMCPFLNIKGWNGPSKNQNAEGQCGKNRGQFGHQHYGMGINLNRAFTSRK
ncbi:hypothetical protein EI94DRAFT_1800329 [Lactarius quietus]|nr:hypothetical protein EI94DRAFT_1800329 [Lactarius quietus]